VLMGPTPHGSGPVASVLIALILAPQMHMPLDLDLPQTQIPQSLNPSHPRTDILTPKLILTLDKCAG
jgi:hypothetical protein